MLLAPPDDHLRRRVSAASMTAAPLAVKAVEGEATAPAAVPEGIGSLQVMLDDGALDDAVHAFAESPFCFSFSSTP